MHSGVAYTDDVLDRRRVHTWQLAHLGTGHTGLGAPPSRSGVAATSSFAEGLACQMCNIQYYMGNVFSYTGLTVFICIKGVKSQKMTMVSRTVTDESLVIVLLFCTLFPVVRMIDRS